MQKDIEEGRNAKGGLNGKIEEQKKEIAHLTQLLDKLKAEDDKLSYSESVRKHFFYLFLLIKFIIRQAQTFKGQLKSLLN